jgi:large subunit ribosomal protein L24
MPQHIRKGDTVMVTAGEDNGRTGKVLRVIPDQQRVVVEGINVHSRHMRPSQSNPQGGVIEKELPLHWSNVSPVDERGKATRVRYEVKPDGSKRRVAATTGEQLGPPLKKARA